MYSVRKSKVVASLDMECYIAASYPSTGFSLPPTHQRVEYRARIAYKDEYLAAILYHFCKLLSMRHFLPF